MYLRKFYHLVIFFLLISGICSKSLAADTKVQPFKTSWLLDGSIAGLGILNAFASSAFDASIIPLTADEIGKLNKNDINSFDRWVTNNYSKKVSSVSDILIGFTILGPVTGLLAHQLNNDWGNIAAIYAETLLWSVFVPSYAKNSVQRTRPFVYNPDAPLEIKMEADARRSFFSGHTCVAFSTAVCFASLYEGYYPDSPLKPYVWGGSLLLASAVGYLRIQSGAHFLTDVLTGAAIGSIIGYAVPYLHRNKEKTSNLSLQAFPLMISLSYKF